MSDDLISRKTLLEEIDSLRIELTGISCLKEFRKTVKEVLTCASHIIDDQPTAFDKEKVIEELKEMATHSASCKNQCEFGSTEYFDYMGAEVAYKTTIEIVEKGGIE